MNSRMVLKIMPFSYLVVFFNTGQLATVMYTWTAGIHMQPSTSTSTSTSPSISTSTPAVYTELAYHVFSLQRPNFH
ncbi:hypothetical protein GGR51DRAFT_338265 [Nemania sp. FL0031]|nr:hypothetical protein GGR51DRAFT_338265 [Nemania sp. FL0031]